MFFNLKEKLKLLIVSGLYTIYGIKQLFYIDIVSWKNGFKRVHDRYFQKPFVNHVIVITRNNKITNNYLMALRRANEVRICKAGYTLRDCMTDFSSVVLLWQ